METEGERGEKDDESNQQGSTGIDCHDDNPSSVCHQKALRLRGRQAQSVRERGGEKDKKKNNRKA
jgi:hypothetical protein